ncbi:IucC family-domain-containing protein [Aspergillus ambiguus]|uniref:IucC family-domain-containing protein n=1 Tax=Aspergillus ambiguus TaxID=176160 RepID=UPI003CCCAF99
MHLRSKALFETTRRLLAQVVNEELVLAQLEGEKTNRYLRLLFRGNAGSKASTTIKVKIKPGTLINQKHGSVTSLLRPENLELPVTLTERSGSREELNPSAIFRALSPGFGHNASPGLVDTIAEELQNSANNQEAWLLMKQSQPSLSLRSPMIAWEQSLVLGHPTHPLHRLCRAHHPLRPVTPNDLPDMLFPALGFVSVPVTDLRISGPFKLTLNPLLTSLGIRSPSDDRVIVPCLAQHLPSALAHFPNAIHVRTVNDMASAQASMRTVSLRPELKFPYHMKLSLACQITSALRTISPNTACAAPAITAILDKTVPPDLWIFREIASATGSQNDYSFAKQLTCILREDLEDRALRNGEALIVTAALMQKVPRTERTYAEVLFDLDTTSDKKNWFRRYVNHLFRLSLYPLTKHGIALETHPQNTLVRICTHTGLIRGFAVRDFGGIRFHKPTLQGQGFPVDWERQKERFLYESMDKVVDLVDHALIQNHIGNMLHALNLERSGGWNIVREELTKTLKPELGGIRRRIYDYLLKERMLFKCFFKMRFEGIEGWVSESMDGLDEKPS